MPRLRWIFAAFAGVSAAGLVPVSTGTAPPGPCLARRAPCTPLPMPVSTAAAIRPSLARESERSVSVRFEPLASVRRAAPQPRAAAPSPAALTAL